MRLLSTGVKGIKHVFVQRAVISSIPYELTCSDLFDFFCATGLLKCSIRFAKIITNVDIYCIVLSGSAATQLR